MTRYLLNICGIFLFLLYGPALSQENFKLEANLLFRPAQLDTAVLLSDTPLKSPWGAVLRSAVVPGWGQIYTRHYFKAGIAFSINAFFIYQIYRYEMKWRDDKNEDFRNKRNRNSWYFALAYLLTMVDTYVDAYLYKFDEAMTISHQLDLRDDVWRTGLKLTFYF
jgi:hypothetical protein